MDTNQKKKIEIRCPKCSRLLAKKTKEGYIEIKSRTSIFLFIKYYDYSIVCKCGYKETEINITS